MADFNTRIQIDKAFRPKWREAVDAWVEEDISFLNPPADGLEAVNVHINQLLTYSRDLYGDVWKHPALLQKEMRGDCEDFALAKFGVLQQRGYRPEIAVVYDPVVRGHHAYCRVGDWLLDQRVNWLIPIDRPEVVPLYSLSAANSYSYPRESIK